MRGTRPNVGLHALAVIVAGACGHIAIAAQATAPAADRLPDVLVSPTGIRLDPRPPTPEQAARISRAEEALARAPRSIEALLEAAQAHEAPWQYRESTALYTRASEAAPEDYRPYLNRAHRTIRLRQFDWAIRDLQQSVALDSYGFNSAYVLGYAYYVTGQFDRAAAEYGRCLALAADPRALALAEAGAAPGDPRSCMMIAHDAASRVAITTWRYRALRRAGQHEEATRLLQTVPPDLDITGAGRTYRDSTIRPDFDNVHYFETLMFYQGRRSEADLLDRSKWGEQWPTVAYGVAVWRLLQGDRAGAASLLEQVVADPNWARFGHVAAEADLVRLWQSDVVR